MTTRTLKGEQGFTLIELLVVVLIIGVLAAIALPTFLGQKEKARDSSVKSDLRNAVSQMEVCYSSRDNYMGCPGSDGPLPIGVAQSVDVGGNAYTVTKTSDSGTVFSIRNAGSEFIRACDTPGIGGCKSDGAGGGTW